MFRAWLVLGRMISFHFINLTRVAGENKQDQQRGRAKTHHSMLAICFGLLILKIHPRQPDIVITVGVRTPQDVWERLFRLCGYALVQYLLYMMSQDIEAID